MPSSICPHCGRPPGSVICQHCGRNVPVVTPSTPVHTHRLSRRARRAIWAAAAVALLLLAAALLRSL